MAEQPGGDDGLHIAIVLFAFYAGCMAFSGWVYWYGTGKLPWQ